MNLQNIPVEKLVHHPKNPRKDIGDITELSDSIKAKGVLQNLTVVPAGDEYYVVIGNRRMEAAKAAGLKTLPCVIAEMDEKEQMETMLLENIQRVDLTVKEQADGFQLMMDLGLTVEELSEKTGFAKSTIYHRLNIAKLDGDVLEQKQVSMKQLIELEKIKSIEKRNKILKDHGGTANFDYWVRIAVQNEKMEDKKTEVLKRVEAAGIPKNTEHKYAWEYGVETVQSIDCRAEDDIPEIKVGEYYIDCGDSIVIANERVVIEKEKTPEEIKLEERRAEFRKKNEYTRTLTEGIREKAEEAVTEYVLSGKEISLSEEERRNLVLYASEHTYGVGDAIGNIINENEEEIKKLFPEAEYEDEMLTEEWREKIEKGLLSKNSDTLILISCRDDLRTNFRTSEGMRSHVAKRDEKVIEILKKIGLLLTEEEQALVDGTSELYEVAKEAEDD